METQDIVLDIHDSEFSVDLIFRRMEDRIELSDGPQDEGEIAKEGEDCGEVGC